MPKRRILIVDDARYARERALAAGASDFLLKPIRSDALPAVLARHLGDS